MSLFFAYASVDPTELAAQLGPPLRLLYGAYLPRHRRVYRGWSTKWQGGVASIKREKDKNVFGFVAQVSEDDLRKLDVLNGIHMVPPKNIRKTVIVKVVIPGRETPANRQAVLYLPADEEFNAPSATYLQKVATTINWFWAGIEGAAVTVESLEVS